MTSCLRHSVCLSLAGGMAHRGSWVTLVVYYCCFYPDYMDDLQWLYRHGCALFAVAKTQTTQKRKTSNTPTGGFLTISFSFLCSLSLLHFPLSSSYASRHTHKCTHINSPLGVCCFHYLQLGPKTVYGVEYSRAELARIALYRGV